MKKVELTCINCPMGCPLVVTMEEGQVTEVTGNTCKRGEVYGRKEVTNPRRVVTSTVAVESESGFTRVPVKTKGDVPKDMVFDCVKALKDVVLKVPIAIGDIVIEDVAGTGIAVVAAKGIK